MTEAPAAACTVDCKVEFPGLPQETHDFLVHLEHDVNAVLRLMVLCESCTDFGVRGEHVGRWAAAHRWQDPLAVYDLCRWIEAILAARHTLHEQHRVAALS